MIYSFNLNDKNIEWLFDPFPHAVIDNFLPDELFKKISQIKVNQIKDIRRNNYTSLELNKKEFGINGIEGIFRIPVDIMGFGEGKNLFSKVIDPEKIITLATHEEFGGYYPFHCSTRGGLLGSHIDHSNIDKNLHFANSIFYSHPIWEKEWGGETILFNSNGFVPIKFINPKPNRLVLFIHTNTSFHGVNKIKCPLNTNRQTYYMDYYLNKKHILELNIKLKKLGFKSKINFSHHKTTFIPFFPLGLKSFNLDNPKTIFRYILIYIYYLIRKITPFKFLNFKIK